MQRGQGVTTTRFKHKPKCPVCDHTLDAATSFEHPDVAPEPGDLTVCIQCVSPLTFKDDMTYQFVDADAFIELPDEARIELTRYMRALHVFKEKNYELQTDNRNT